jgi:hypothetical protein
MLGVDIDPAHARKVDDQAGVAHGVSGHIVPATAHGDYEALLARERNGSGHVGFVLTADNQLGAPVDHAVEDAPGLVILGVAGANDRAADLA